MEGVESKGVEIFFRRESATTMSYFFFRLFIGLSKRIIWYILLKRICFLKTFSTIVLRSLVLTFKLFLIYF